MRLIPSLILKTEPRTSATLPRTDADVGATDGRGQGVPGVVYWGIYRVVYSRVHTLERYPARYHGGVSLPGTMWVSLMHRM